MYGELLSLCYKMVGESLAGDGASGSPIDHLCDDNNQLCSNEVIECFSWFVVTHDSCVS